MSKVRARYMTRRGFFSESCIAVIGISYLGVGFKADAAPGEEPPATHNMLVIGEKTVFLSHLPMFGSNDPMKRNFSPHRFQVILEATFTDGNRNMQEAYTEDRRKHPNVKMYTLNPKEFVLARLDAPNRLSEFKGTVFRGHLERPGRENILGNIVVDIKKVIHFREFDPKATKPSHLEYLVFGKGNELFLAHLITLPPDFDQILSVKVSGHTFTDAELGQGVRIVIPESTNSARHRIKETQEVAAEISAAGGGATKTLKLQAGIEFYFEEGELHMPPNFDDTEEEQKAGFGEQR
jgi:hypothetical protein